METFLTIASRREGRDYAPEPIPMAAVHRILQAGRVAGSAMNTQPWRFTCVQGTQTIIERLSKGVTRPTNLEGAKLLILVSLTQLNMRSMFDAGRAVENMLLAAWDQGIASCPNSVRNPAKMYEEFQMAEEQPLVALISFGYPRRRPNFARRTDEEWAATGDRLPLDEIVRWVHANEERDPRSNLDS